MGERFRLTIPEQERVAKLATDHIANVYRNAGWKNPPRFSNGAVCIVLNAAEHVLRNRPTDSLPPAPQEQGET